MFWRGDAARADRMTTWPTRIVPRRRPSAEPSTFTGAAIDPDAWPTRAFLALADVLRRYHRHRVVRLGRLHRLLRGRRPVLLVGNHALDIVDPLLFLATVFRTLHRLPQIIGNDNGSVSVPVLREILPRFQVIPSPLPAETLEPLHRDGFLI